MQRSSEGRWSPHSLLNVCRQAPAPPINAILGSMRFERFVNAVLSRVRDCPVELGLLSPDAVPGSLFSGAAGVAFFLYEVGRLRKQDELLDRARLWCAAGRRWANHASLSDWKGHPYGFLIGETGLSYVEVLLSAHRGDVMKVQLAAQCIAEAAILHEASHARRPDEFLAGTAGLLCAARDLDARLPRDVIYDAARHTLGRVRNAATAKLLAGCTAPVDPAHDEYLGLAHGVAGQLFALLSVVGASNELLRARLDDVYCQKHVDPDGYLYWFPTGASRATEFLGTWCHGMAGHTLLWCGVAHELRTLESERLALRTAESTFLLLSPNATLCCGLAGQSVALQRYADLANDARFTRRAATRLSQAIRLAENTDERSLLHLWKGKIGVALTAAYRQSGERTFPCLESPIRYR